MADNSYWQLQFINHEGEMRVLDGGSREAMIQAANMRIMVYREMIRLDGIGYADSQMLEEYQKSLYIKEIK